MTDPKHAQNVPGKGRYYFHPQTGETWPSITNVLGVSVAKPALVPAAVKITAEHAVQTMPRYLAAMTRPVCKPKKVADECGTCRDCLHKTTKREHRRLWERASDLGTRAHAWAENAVLGHPPLDDPEVEAFGQQFLRFLADYGVDLDRDIEASEATIINRKHGYAGTGDLWLRLRVAGQRSKVLSLLDIKTSEKRKPLEVYPDNAMQLAALANGETLLLPNGTEVPAPKGIKAYYVLSLRLDDYALVPMPMHGTIAEAFAGFRGALANANWLHSQHGHKPVAAEPHITRQPAQKVA